MRASDFQPGFPGQLEPTAFDELDPNGNPQTTRGLAFVPLPLPPTLDVDPMIGRLFDLLDRVKTSLLRLEMTIDSLPGKTVLLSAMRVREAQASSKIENTYASVKDIALAAIDERRATDDSMEVLRNRRAIEEGLASPLPMSNRVICAMHRVLITDQRYTPGRFRNLQVCIGSAGRGFEYARFVPPPPHRIESCMRAFELFCNPNATNAPQRTRLPYFVELALAHYQFETIHPFRDGNGRLGRALVTIAPLKDGVLRHPVCNLSEWVHSNREEYYDRLLRVSTHAEWEPWIRFFCTALAGQAQADLDRAQRLGKLYDKYFKAITTKKSSMIVTKLLDHLFDHQVTTIGIAASVMGLSHPAAKRHIDNLEKLKVIKAMPGRDYARIYFAEGIIRAIKGQGED